MMGVVFKSDMGSFKIELSPSSLLLRLERVTMAEGCKAVLDDGGGIEVAAGRDDKVFRLQRE